MSLCVNLLYTVRGVILCATVLFLLGTYHYVQVLFLASGLESQTERVSNPHDILIHKGLKLFEVALVTYFPFGVKCSVIRFVIFLSWIYISGVARHQ